MHQHLFRAGVVVAFAALLGPGVRGQEAYRFRTGVEVINVTATVTDAAGRTAAGLTRADFTVYEDDQPVEISYFNAERVPVSLGIVLDTSGSMRGEKLAAARGAVDRFLFELLGPDDEFFVYRFDNAPHLLSGWTRDRSRVAAELAAVRADGATALYDAIAEALPLLQSGRHAKKALLVISDGNDSTSRLQRPALQGMIRESDAVVYAIGIDTQRAVSPAAGGLPQDRSPRFQRRRPMPRPMPRFPMPRGRTPPRTPPIPGTPPTTGVPPAPGKPGASERASRGATPESEPVDAAALHDLTEASGGRTEIVRNTLDLTGTASRIADELAQQYFLAYPSRDYRDGRWHTIRVEVRDRALQVRARRGYLATAR